MRKDDFRGECGIAHIHGMALLARNYEGARHLPHLGVLWRRSSGIRFFVPQLRHLMIISSSGARHLPHVGLSWRRS